MTAKLAMVDVSKRFERRGQAVVAIEGLDISIAPGEFVTIVGPSGCGKTTQIGRAHV